MLFSSTHAVAKGRSSFFFLLHNIPLYKCSSFLIHTFTNGHLGCFQHLAVVSNAAVNIGVHRFFWVGDSGFSWYIIPAVGLLDQKAVPFLVFWGNSILLSTVATPVCIPNSSARGFPFLHILASTYLLVCLWWPFWLVWSGISFLICISLMTSDTEHFFHVSLGSLYVLLGEVSVHVFCQFLIALFFFLVWSCVS